MLVTITQFSRMALDANGSTIFMGKDRIACEARTTAGSFTALNSDAAFVRIATDTAIQIDVTGGATTSADELFMPGVEYIAVNGGETLAFIAVA